jgi:hypothetical protein
LAAGNRRASSAACRQWVVQRRPSSRQRYQVGLGQPVETEPRLDGEVIP